MPQFEISVVIPVYNAEAYLEETLASVEAQTLGMDAIQVILVDDGSTDGSPALCEAFRSQYPDNVTLVRQENQGVSAARNTGIEYVQGEYLTFLDSDDTWTPKSFKNALRFFKGEGRDVDVVVGDMVLFEKRKSDHPLAYRFKKKKKGVDRLIALGTAPCDVQSTIGNCFFRTSAIGDHRFDTDLSTSEDTLFVSRILLEKCLYGAAPECVYHYRKRADGTSLSQVATHAKHMQNLEVCERLFASSMEKLGYVHPFIQATALYIINWQLFGTVNEPLSEQASEEWQTAVSDIVDKVNTDVIARARWAVRDKKIRLYKMKFGDDFFRNLVWVDNRRGYFQGRRVISFNVKADCDIYLLEQRGENLHIEGLTDVGFMGIPYQYFVWDRKSDKRYYANLSPYPAKNKYSLAGDLVFAGARFVVDIPLKPDCRYEFWAHLDDEGQELRLSPHFGLFAKFVQTAQHDYCVFGNIVAKHIDEQIRTYRATPQMKVASELRRLREIMSNDKFTVAERLSYSWLRLRAHAHRAFSKKPIWIFADKEWKAGDNAENVYRYAMRSGYKGAKMYFSLETTASDYDAVKAYGHVLDPRTSKYKLKFLLSQIVVSSRTEMSVVNPFGSELVLVKDMLNYSLVYLTHGTLFGDLASMLGRANRPISLFSVSTQMERNALLTESYGYADDEVRLLGMARYDEYGKAHKKKLIAFLPTWRANLAGAVIPGTSEREYVAHFASTDYCKFYTGLINNERLLNAMRQHGFTGEFYVHPAFEKQAGDFKGNDIIRVGEGSADYERVLSDAAILVTDYSGVGFDFGYQRQPLVYCQFDSVFGSGHSYGDESYFDYKEEGFGPVTETLEETVQAIIDYMDNECQVEDVYKNRADAMFGNSDYQNCNRIFDAIVDLSRRKEAQQK